MCRTHSMLSKAILRLVLTFLTLRGLIHVIKHCNHYSENQSGTWDHGLQSSSSGYGSGLATSDVSQKERAALNACLPVDDDDNDSDWGEDEWPIGRPLPLPEWGCERPEVRFVSPAHYREFLWRATEHLRAALTSQPYDSISDFVWFSREYVNQRREYPELSEFYRDYDPPMVPGRYTCVGLATDLATRLAHMEECYPGLKDATYQVSCEEETSLQPYMEVREPPVARCLKEHVLLCVRMRINQRPGVILFDPGYHIAEPITIMEDGRFPQSDVLQGSTAREEVKRHFRYNFLPGNTAFVKWTVEEFRNGVLHKKFSNVIHVARPFLSGIDIAERRVLVYRFKTLLGRNAEGRLTCGAYLPIRTVAKTTITFFHEFEGEMKFCKKPLSYFLQGNTALGEEEAVDLNVEEAIETVAKGTARTTEELRETLVEIAHLLQDDNFLRQLKELDEAIEDIPNVEG